MKPISEKQKNAIMRLARATRTEVESIEGMSSFEASSVITALIEKMNQQKGNGNEPRKASRNYSSDALAGLAVKILAQRHKVDEIIKSADRFKAKTVELYKVFESARRECLA